MGLLDFGGGFDPFDVSGPLPGLGGGPLPGVSLSDVGGGGGGFNFGSLLGKDQGALGGLLDVGKFGLTAGLGIKSQIDNARYQKQLQDYYKQQSAMQAQYNASVQDYLKQRAAWENQMQSSFQGVFDQFGESMSGFQDTIGGIVNQELAAAQPLLSQSQQLLEPAVAALAKGEVPPLFAPVLEQAKQRARAAAVQQYENSGQSVPADIEPQIDQQVQQMLIQAATGMLTSGLSTGQQGLSALGGATSAAASGMTPLMAEFQAMMSAMSGLFGGFPGLQGGVAPPAPVA